MPDMMARTQVEEQEIGGPTTVKCRHEEKLPEEGEHLSPINWLHGVIRILRVLRYKVIFAFWIKVLSNLIFSFPSCYLLCWGLVDHMIKRFTSSYI
jgi:hypothetical protein